MKICLSSKFLGTSDSLVWDPEDDTYSWSDTVPDDSWIFCDENSVRDMGSVAKAVDFSISRFEDTPWGESFRQLGVDDIPPWPWVVPPEAFKKQLRRALDQLWLLIGEEYNGYYMQEFVTNREVLTGLRRAHVNMNKFNKYVKISSKSGGTSEILSFSPDESGRCDQIVYDQSSSTTGRLTVRSGPKILTLRKRFRDMLKSKSDNGTICQVDLVSLEPRIALRVNDKNDTHDIYSQIIDEIFNGCVSRDRAKIASIACLYGMSSRSLRDHFPDENTVDILSRMKNFFGINDLERRLRNEENDCGYIRNFYGRKVKGGTALVNHYVQSTGVDVSLQCFRDLTNRISSSSIDADPIFVVHDALIIDLKSGKIDDISDIIDKGLNSPGFEKPFPVTVEEISK